jgi:hypothetical protein
LASEKQKADVIVGNPPWLAYRAMNKPTQKRFMEEMKATGIWGGLSSVSGYDLSAYFFARAVQLYMRQTGSIAFVMPFASMTRKPYVLFRSGAFKVGGYGEGRVKFTTAWALPSDVQPLFPVPACVLFAERSKIQMPLPHQVLYFSGRLPRRDAHEDEATSTLKESLGPWPSEADEAIVSPYKDHFRNGAVLWPRRLVIVNEVTQGRLGGNPTAPIVQGRVTNLDKKPWSELEPIRGPVEREFLRAVYLGESIAPYRILEPVTGVIPIEPTSNTLLDSGAAAGRGYTRLSSFLNEAETVWRANSKQARTFLEQIDFFGNLSGQLPIAPLRVVYTKTGTNLAATILRDQRGIVENGLYWTGTESEDEAHFLVAILNSETTRARAEKYQSTGQWGARHFDRVIFNLPIPKYSSSLALHAELANTAQQAERVAEAVPLRVGEHFTRARKNVRNAILDAGIATEIETLVSQLFDGAAKPKRKR